ncbi:Uma2 family endonuclease [Treponema primitia]|uniref:Uma2 family endonuclease n=1 Tax=Treponema primitia TaxID=88058 RepID=UPI00397EDB4B
MSDAARKLDDPRGHFTYADYRQWELAEGERYELIDGVAYAMGAPNDAHAMAGPDTEHQLISGELFRQIANYLHGKPCKVFSAPFDVRLFYQEDETDITVVQPDISVICDAKKIGTEGCRGAPNLVIEILSPSNTGEESVKKFNLYLEAGVQEYWIVSPKSKTVQVNILEDGAYQARTYKADAVLPVRVLEGLSITLGDVFN